MKYTLDSNILINMERLYPRDIFISLWSSIENLVSRGEVCICEAVLAELQRGDGTLLAAASTLIPRLRCNKSAKIGKNQPFRAATMRRTCNITAGVLRL